MSNLELYPITKLSETTFSVELDIAHCVTLGEFLESLEPLKLTIGKFTAIGPAGGNPLVEFIGTHENLTAFVNQLNS